MITLKNINKIYSNGSIKVTALQNINLEINKGEFISIVGASGSGKSTLLHLLGGLDIATQGEIIVDSVNIRTLNDDQLSKYRRDKVGFIFQFFNLVPILNVEENITLPIRIAKKNIDIDYMNELMDILDLKNRSKHLPSQLSGGQQQRVAIARALLSRPNIILADEPTGNLDSTNTKEVISLLKYASTKYNQTVVIVTHDSKISQQANRIITMKDGSIISDEIISSI
ncbi:ABC transporter ATP-binding protein [Clostridium gasigenes]|uniref:ABC transporter ATP-binding protein n=1 Tax=Clostridium gasigenes TaxID=94869 RepID=UPI001C0AB9D6|nr:ABC transporter ATP-binding protein [Clostridium gasigenes]MBU3136353.1 ABC transporter ATP-binding protein [Clostridium gasigenes]